MITPALLFLLACITDDNLEDTATVPPDAWGFVSVASEPGLGFSDASAILREQVRFAYDCTAETVAGCRVLRCGDDLNPTTPVDAGPITITGASEPIALAFDAGYEPVFLTGETLFSGGEALTATAPGGEGPAIDLAVTAPQPVSVTTPAWPDGGEALSLDPSADLALTWTGESAGDVVIHFADPNQNVVVSCPFAASSGGGSVPAAALAALPSGGGSVDVELRSEAVQRVGSWELTFTASTHAEVPGGSLAIAPLRVE